MSSEDIKSIGRQLRQIEDPNTRRMFERILESIDTTKISLAALEEPELEGWKDLILLNSWVEFDTSRTPPQYMKTSDGIVHLRGTIKNGTTTSGTNLFNVPAGYRPDFRHSFSLDSNLLHGRIDVYPDGNVKVVTVSATHCCFDGIVYRAAR